MYCRHASADAFIFIYCKVLSQNAYFSQDEHRTVGQIRGDEAHFRLCEFTTPLGHFRPKLTAWDRLGLFRANLELFGPFWTILAILAKLL